MVSPAALALPFFSLLGSLGFTMWMMMRWNINPAALLKYTLKLIREDKTARALKLAHATGNALYGQLIAAVLTSLEAAPDDALAAVGKVTREGLLATEAKLQRAWRVLAALGVLCAISLLYAVAEAIRPGMVISAISGGLLVMGGRTLRGIERAARGLPLDLLPTLLEQHTGEVYGEAAILEALGVTEAEVIR